MIRNTTRRCFGRIVIVSLRIGLVGILYADDGASHIPILSLQALRRSCVELRSRVDILVLRQLNISLYERSMGHFISKQTRDRSSAIPREG